MKKPTRAPLPQAVSIPVSPTSAETASAIREIAKKSPKWVKIKKVGVTHENRPIDAVTITDPTVPDKNKQHLLVIGGRNGNEESGRAIAIAFIEWLTTPEARETRRKQKIIIMPNMNPDGAERDIYRDVINDITPCCELIRRKPQPPEGAAYLKVLESFNPDAHVDLHARGHTGYSYDMVLWAHPQNYTEDENLLHRIANDMAENAENETGIPHTNHSLGWPGWAGDSETPSTYTFNKYKSLSFLTESAESNISTYPLAKRSKAGLARLKSLVSWGNQRFPKLYYPGYPGYLVTSMFTNGIVAVGKTAEERRKSRINAWQSRPDFARFGVESPQLDKEKHILMEYNGKALPTGVGMQFITNGRKKIEAVFLNGKKLRQSETNGYYSWYAGKCTCVVIVIPKLKKGRYVSDVYFQ